MNMPADISFLFFIMVISAFLLVMFAVCVLWAVVTGLLEHYFPDCAYSKWIKAEVLHEEDLSFKTEQQDWIAKRMNK